METVVVILIVGAAVIWAGREVWRALRPRPTSACGCPSASRCAVARNCAKVPPAVPAAADRAAQNPGSRVT